MAFACSDNILCSYAYLSRDCSIGNNSRSCQSRNVVTEVRKVELQRSSPIESSLYLKKLIFSSSFGLEGSGFCSKKRKWNFDIRSESQFELKVDSSDTRTIALPQEGGDVSLNKEVRNLEPSYGGDLDFGAGTGDSSGSGGDGNFPSGGGGGAGGSDHGGNEEDNKEDSEFGPVLRFQEVIRETENWGATLPSDMLEAARTVGIQKVLLLRYLELQASAWPLGYAMKSCSLLRNRMLADPSFLFKVGLELIIDTASVTFAEVQKRGKDFWAEFELYTADLLVGLAVNVALVGMLAPYSRFGRLSSSKGFFGQIRHAFGALPSSVFEAERPGCRYSNQQRIGTYFYKGLLYGSVGFACGIVGQGIANFIMSVKRCVKKSDEDIPVPPLVKSAALWGVFLAVSSNTRYQIINGLEQFIEASPLARRVPTVAMAFTVGVRSANNIFGGMQFVDWARWSGVQ